MPNGWRYLLNFKPHKKLENAQSPTSQVHAVLGGGFG
jgi:hypothetical protein